MKNLVNAIPAVPRVLRNWNAYTLATMLVVSLLAITGCALGPLGSQTPQGAATLAPAAQPARAASPQIEFVLPTAPTGAGGTAPTEALFGPKTYTRDKGAPSTVTDTFTIPAGVSAPFLLRIENGALAVAGAKPVTSATVTINGVQVAGPGDFGGTVTLVEKPVTLSGGSNTLEVRMAGAPGAAFRLRLLGTPAQSIPTSLAPNPLVVTTGATGNLTATLSPVPTSAGNLIVSSANTNVANVPASVAFSVGQTSVVIPVNGVTQGNTTVNATLNGRSASATVNVSPAPPSIASLLPASLLVTQFATGALTVTLTSAPATNTAVALSSSFPGVASVPASINVPAGQITASIPVNGLNPGSAEISASLNNSKVSTQITVNPAPPTVVSLLPVNANVTLGATTSLTLTLSAAQSTDTVVPISVGPPGIATAPAQVTVPAKQTSVTVPVTGAAFGQAGVTASLNNSSTSAVVNVIAPPVAVVSLVPSPFTMNVGAVSSFTVTLNATQPGNTDIALTVNNPAALKVPANVTIAQGQLSATFTATAQTVGDAVITASANNTSQSANVHISPQPAAIVSLLPNPLPLQQGVTGSLTVTLNVAQEAATPVTLASSSPAVAQVAPSISIPPGQISAAIPVNALAPGNADITASVTAQGNLTNVTTRVEVTEPPPVVSSITPATLTLPKGTPGTLRVAVSRAPSSATAVTLTSSNLAVASVPPTVNIAAGALFAEFPVSANAEGQATLTATLNGGAASSNITVTPAEVSKITLSPQTPSAYVGENIPFTATATLSDGSSRNLSAEVTWASSDTTTASIANSGIANALASGQTTISASYTFTAAQNGQTVVVTSSTPLTVKAPVGLTLTAPSTTLQPGQSASVTINSPDAAPAGGLTISLTQSGTGTGTFPASAVMAEGQNSVTFSYTAKTAGIVTLTATAPSRLPGMLTLTAAQAISITAFTPATGPTGTAVLITGVGFDPVANNNQVRFNGIAAEVISASATTLSVVVPPRAASGPITVTNVRGTATSATPFTVQDRDGFDIVVAPAAVQAPQGGTGSAKVTLTNAGLFPYPYAATLSVSGVPAGVTTTLSRPTVFLNGESIITFSVAQGSAPGVHNITVSAVGQANLGAATKTRTLTLEILAAGATTVSGRVLHADDGAPFVGARVRLGTASVTTDATGSYRFVNPPVLGDQVLLIDGNTNNSPTAEYPSGIAMPVMIVANQDNRALTSFVGRIDPTQFTAVTPGQAASVTSPDIPNFALNIPAGASIIGWDGKPVDKINVRVVPVDRLPIRPLPPGVTTRSVYLYYFFREGGGTPTQPIPVTMNNDIDALPGEQITLWYYDESPTPDANSNQWRVMGMGTVSADGKSIVSNPGVGIPKFCCGATTPQRNDGGGTDPGATGGDGPNWAPSVQSMGDTGDTATGADVGPTGTGEDVTGGTTRPTGCPVDLASGNALVFRPRPFGISRFISVNPNCQYRSTDARVGLFGRGMSFTYDWFAVPAGPEAVRVTNPAGARYLLSREADGVFRARSGRKRAIEMEVTPTPTGRTLKLVDGTRLEFNNAGQLTAFADLSNNRVSFTLNAQGFPQSMSDAGGKVYQFQTAGSPPIITRIADPAGRYIEMGYDANRRMTSYRDQGGGVTLLEYDANNRIIRKTDPRGAVEQIEYDSVGRTTREVLPEGGVQSFAYTVAGSTVAETRHTDENGNTRRYRWNGFGYVTQETDALGRDVRFERDPASSLVRRRIDQVGRATQFAYNARGDLVRTIDADGNQTLIEYDLRFRKPVRIENALGNVVTMEYNSQGKVSRVTNAENERVSYTYTSRGQLETVTDALNRVTRFTYDNNGNLIESINAAQESVTRAYDAANRLTQLTDALGRTSAFTYDNLDRVIEIRNAAQGVSKISYDANDNRLSVTDQNNNPVERNVYDLRSRLTQKTDAKNKNNTYAYDAVGNITRVTDRKGQATQFTYDALNRVTQVTDHDGRTTSTFYDLAGNIARISDSQSGDLLMRFDNLNRVLEVVSPQGSITYAYDAIGRVTSRAIAGGDVTTYTYDKANRVKSIALKGKTATYTYDAAGRLIQRTLPNGMQVANSFDAVDRVTRIEYKKSDNTPLETINYSYDAGGQRISRGVGGPAVPETPFSATYDEASRLTAITINGEAHTLVYDDNGNLTSKTGTTSGVTTYSWTARNQLAQITAPNLTASFKYDALGRRIEKTVNGNTTGFLYSGSQAIAELRANAIDTVYHTGLQIDEVLAHYGSAGNRTLLTDALMSVIAQASDAETIDNTYNYSPYGQVQASGADQTNSLQYTGRENDQTGLYYYRARYYDPVLKRFISEDPIGVAGGINLYAYVGGNPVNYTDPSGQLIPLLVGAAGFYLFMNSLPDRVDWLTTHEHNTSERNIRELKTKICREQGTNCDVPELSDYRKDILSTGADAVKNLSDVPGTTTAGEIRPGSISLPDWVKKARDMCLDLMKR